MCQERPGVVVVVVGVLRGARKEQHPVVVLVTLNVNSPRSPLLLSRYALRFALSKCHSVFCLLPPFLLLARAAFVGGTRQCLCPSRSAR